MYHFRAKIHIIHTYNDKYYTKIVFVVFDACFIRNPESEV